MRSDLTEKDPATYSRGLLDALQSLSQPSAQEVWTTVIDFIEPLAILKETVSVWGAAWSGVNVDAEVVEDVLLMLDPELACDSFHRPNPSPPVVTCCPDLPGPLDFSLPFVLSGPCVSFQLDAPPSPSFCYPFIGGVSLAAAKRQAAYLEAACDVVGNMVQRTQSERVFLKASRQTLAAIEPIPTWLLSVGFCLVAEGIISPQD